jgi:diguanylate cyclase (GGDEF)-like protein/PAS domain S-box-containing protein
MDEKAFLAAIVDSSADAIIGKTLNGTILSWNRGAQLLYGYGAEEMVGQPIERLVPRGRDSDVPSILASIRRNERVANYETERQRRDGTILSVSLTVSPVHDEAGNVVAAATIARDVSERKRLDEQLKRLVYHDDLTGLANRRRFLMEVDRKVSHGERYGWRGAVLLLDLDNFKALNDALGHNAGDNLIKRAALRMREAVRATDLLARLGGDEFALLMPESDRADAESVAAKLVETMARQEVLIDHKRVGTVSVGVCVLDEPVASEEPLSRADIAMYKVKDRGGNGYAFFDPAEDGERAEELALAPALTLQSS